jgi:CRISPR-associated protein Csb2
MLTVTVRFPLGVYHAQSAADFSEPEWPPHPVRLIAALVAAARDRVAPLEGADESIDLLATAHPPRIVAPRAIAISPDPATAPDGMLRVARLRGASRWAPRNHELGELKNGVSPRDLGRGRAEVYKVGVAIGHQPIAFVWDELSLAPASRGTLQRLAADVTVLGASRSPVLLEVCGMAPPEEGDAGSWVPADSRAAVATVDVRVATPATVADLDARHGRRMAAPARSGAPSRAPYVAPGTTARRVPYAHSAQLAELPAEPYDPREWGEFIVVALDPEANDVRPKAPVAFSVARATRRALLSTYGDEGTTEEAPPVLRARGKDPHAALVPLSFVGPPSRAGAGAKHADGRIMGLAVLLPHHEREPDMAVQRLRIESGLRALAVGTANAPRIPVHVPSVGSLTFRLVPNHRVPESLREGRYVRASRRWTTVTPVVHSHHLRSKGRTKREHALHEQVARDCRDVGLPAPAEVTVRRAPRLRGAPGTIELRGLPPEWAGPVRGPRSHLDLVFEQPVVGPVLLGRARHFGIGLCLPVPDGEAA